MNDTMERLEQSLISLRALVPGDVLVMRVFSPNDFSIINDLRLVIAVNHRSTAAWHMVHVVCWSQVRNRLTIDLLSSNIELHILKRTNE